MCVEADVEVLVARAARATRSRAAAAPLADGVDPDSLVAARRRRAAARGDRARAGRHRVLLLRGVGQGARERRRAGPARSRTRRGSSAKIENPIKRDLVIDTFAKALEIGRRVVRTAVARAAAGTPRRRDHGRSGARHADCAGGTRTRPVGERAPRSTPRREKTPGPAPDRGGRAHFPTRRPPVSARNRRGRQGFLALDGHSASRHVFRGSGGTVLPGARSRAASLADRQARAVRKVRRGQRSARAARRDDRATSSSARRCSISSGAREEPRRGASAAAAIPSSCVCRRSSPMRSVKVTMSWSNNSWHADSRPTESRQSERWRSTPADEDARPPRRRRPRQPAGEGEGRLREADGKDVATAKDDKAEEARSPVAVTQGGQAAAPAAKAAKAPQGRQVAAPRDEDDDGFDGDDDDEDDDFAPAAEGRQGRRASPVRRPAKGPRPEDLVDMDDDAVPRSPTSTTTTTTISATAPRRSSSSRGRCGRARGRDARGKKGRGGGNAGAATSAKDKLIELGKQKGFVTYDEVNDAMPEDVVSTDQIDSWLSALGDHGIEVVDGAGAAPPATSSIPPEGPRHREGKGEKARSTRTRSTRTRVPATPSACTCARWARSRCSPARARSRSRSASRTASARCSRPCSTARSPSRS